jgi:hypothetical protein
VHLESKVYSKFRSLNLFICYVPSLPRSKREQGPDQIYIRGENGKINQTGSCTYARACMDANAALWPEAICTVG